MRQTLTMASAKEKAVWWQTGRRLRCRTVSLQLTAVKPATQIPKTDSRTNGTTKSRVLNKVAWDIMPERQQKAAICGFGDLLNLE